MLKYMTLETCSFQTYFTINKKFGTDRFSRLFYATTNNPNIFLCISETMQLKIKNKQEKNNLRYPGFAVRAGRR